MITPTNRAIHVDFLVAVFAIGSWVCIRGIHVELPLIVPALPEGWALPSIMSIIITISNIGPAIFAILIHVTPKCMTEKRGIYLIIMIGSAATALLAIYWKSTAFLWGHERSVALFALIFFLGMVDCSSRVLYVPFMSKFQEPYLVSYFLGEGFSGFLPSVFALIQGVGGSPECRPISIADNSTCLHLVYPAPLFSVETYFYLLLGMFVASALAFHLLNYHSIVHKALMVETVEIRRKGLTLGVDTIPISKEEIHDSNLAAAELSVNAFGTSIPRKTLQAPPINSELFYYFLSVQFIVCLVSNGFLMPIQTYSCLPYGNEVYHLAATLSMMTNPVVCVILKFPVPGPSRSSVNIGCVLATIFTAYVTMSALNSPNPPLRDHVIGKVLIVFCWIAVMATFIYIKVSNATLLKRLDGKRGLFWFGVVTQIGSAIGSLTTFTLVNFTTIFKSQNRLRC